MKDVRTFAVRSVVNDFALDLVFEVLQSYFITVAHVCFRTFIFSRDVSSTMLPRRWMLDETLSVRLTSLMSMLGIEFPIAL